MIVQLGKFGDCINILPYAYMLHERTGAEIPWLIGKQWASILDGVSYVKPVIWNGSDDDLPKAVSERKHLLPNHLGVTQAWRNPDPFRETDSFAKEQWRYVRALNERGKWPLVFDKRDSKREMALTNQYIDCKKKNILVGTTSFSTSFKHAHRLLSEIRSSFPDMNVIHLDAVWATQLYDMLALYDAADLLITVDTCHLHLARASYCPVIALVNDGWKGAVPPPQTIAAWRYSELGDDLAPVITAARNQLGRKVETMTIICDSNNQSSDRHKRAMDTHPIGMIYFNNDRRPTTHEIFSNALADAPDAIVFTHDDVSFKPDTLGRIKAHLQKFDFGCSRRHAGHIGREIFWFKSDWLRKHWDALPNPYWSVQKPDLILARWMRHLKGIPTTMHNLNYDFPPVELDDVIYHEDHESNWANAEVEGSMEGQHNERMWEEWI